MSKFDKAIFQRFKNGIRQAMVAQTIFLDRLGNSPDGAGRALGIWLQFCGRYRRQNDCLRTALQHRRQQRQSGRRQKSQTLVDGTDAKRFDPFDLLPASQNQFRGAATDVEHQTFFVRQTQHAGAPPM